MPCPAEEQLALYAGGDLGRLDSWRISRHVSGCSDCRSLVNEFQSMTSELASEPEMPAVDWSAVSREMQANIRLGLEAGECVSFFSEPAAKARWTLAAYACAVFLVAFGIWWQRSNEMQTAGVVIAASDRAIELREDGQSMRLLQDVADSGEVNYSVNAQGSIGARYFDADTGYVTVQNVVALQ